MYYYNITEDACIGGKNDASISDVLIEIKTRTRKQNIRRNEYDLYQLICYLMATGIEKGKVVQMYNKEKWSKDDYCTTTTFHIKRKNLEIYQDK